MKLVFWNYNYLHIKNYQSIFTIDDIINLNLTFEELFIKHGIGISIKIFKVFKHNPREIINKEEPYWNISKTKIIDYINYYDIRGNSCDIIFSDIS